MSWRLEAAAEEADRMVAMLRAYGSGEGATCAAVRAAALRDALALLARDVAEAEEEPEEAAQESAGARAPGPPSYYTPERRTLLAALWGDLSVRTADVLERVNALPGPQIASTEALRQGVRHRCGLPGSRTAYATQIEAAARATPDARVGIDPGQTALAGISPEEIAEARSLLQGPGGGALKLVDWFGWELPRAQAIAEALRAMQAAA